MAQRYDADREPIGSLLTTTSPRIVVPEWQRSYSWDTSQVETFWNDLIAFSERYPGDNISGQEYFLGSIVLVTGGASLELLDGQQRLATATILLSVLRGARATFNQDSATRLQTKYIGDFDDASEETQYNLTLNRYDWEFFRAEIQDAGGAAPAPKLKSHKRIRDARRFFEERVEDGRAVLNDNNSKHQWVLRIGKVLLDHMSVVAVSSTDPDNAAAVFETLNDRGIGLSTPDLLRNFLLREAGDDSDVRSRIVSAWETVLAVDEEGSVDKYLRHYWVSHQGDVKNRKLYREIKEELQANGPNPLDFSTDLAETASLYRDLVNGREENADLRRDLESIKALGADVLYPALLAAYTHVTDDNDKSDVIRLAQALITMFVRSAVIGGREAGKIESTCYTTAKELRADGDLDKAIEALRNFSPDPSEFLVSFARAAVSRRATARYLLREIEHAKRETGEVGVEGTDRVHVEHIYPQEPKEGARLPNHAAVLNRLGNLTLLSRRLNTSIRNADFATKKTAAYEASDILMTKDLLAYAEWNANTIAARQGELATWAFRSWNFPGESDPGTVDITTTGEKPTAAELPEVPDVEDEAPPGAGNNPV